MYVYLDLPSLYVYLDLPSLYVIAGAIYLVMKLLKMMKKFCKFYNEQLGSPEFVWSIGGTQYSYLLLQPLEELAN